jgi:hypothetical protein
MNQDADQSGTVFSRTLSPALVAEYQTKLPDKAVPRAGLEMMDAAMELNDEAGRDEG